MVIKRTRPDEAKKGAPRYLVSFSSIMTLLLAFFIILQAFASVQEPGLFYAGRGSFIRALETGGLGGFWDRNGSGHDIPRYLAPEGQTEAPRERRIDPEMEDGQQAAERLEQEAAVRGDTPPPGPRRVLSTPVVFGPAKSRLTEAEGRFLSDLAPHVAPLLRTEGCLVGVGATFVCSDRNEAAVTRRALRAASEVRRRLLEAAGPSDRNAARVLYAFARREVPAPGDAPRPEGDVRILLFLNRTAAPKVETGAAPPVQPIPETPKGEDP